MDAEFLAVSMTLAITFFLRRSLLLLFVVVVVVPFEIGAAGAVATACDDEAAVAEDIVTDVEMVDEAQLLLFKLAASEISLLAVN